MKTRTSHPLFAPCFLALGQSGSGGGPNPPEKDVIAVADPFRAYVELEKLLAGKKPYHRLDPNAAERLRGELIELKQNLLAEQRTRLSAEQREFYAQEALARAQSKPTIASWMEDAMAKRLARIYPQDSEHVNKMLNAAVELLHRNSAIPGSDRVIGNALMGLVNPWMKAHEVRGHVHQAARLARLIQDGRLLDGMEIEVGRDIFIAEWIFDAPRGTFKKMPIGPRDVIADATSRRAILEIKSGSFDRRDCEIIAKLLDHKTSFSEGMQLAGGIVGKMEIATDFVNQLLRYYEVLDQRDGRYSTLELHITSANQPTQELVDAIATSSKERAKIIWYSHLWERAGIELTSSPPPPKAVTPKQESVALPRSTPAPSKDKPKKTKRGSRRTTRKLTAAAKPQHPWDGIKDTRARKKFTGLINESGKLSHKLRIQWNRQNSEGFTNIVAKLGLDIIDEVISDAELKREIRSFKDYINKFPEGNRFNIKRDGSRLLNIVKRYIWLKDA